MRETSLILLVIWAIAMPVLSFVLAYFNLARIEEAALHWRIEHASRIPWMLMNKQNRKLCDLNPNYRNYKGIRVEEETKYGAIVVIKTLSRVLGHGIILLLLIIFSEFHVETMLVCLALITVWHSYRVLTTGRWSYYIEQLNKQFIQLKIATILTRKLLEAAGYHFFSDGSYKYKYDPIASEAFDNEMTMIYTALKEWSSKQKG